MSKDTLAPVETSPGDTYVLIPLVIIWANDSAARSDVPSHYPCKTQHVMFRKVLE